MLLYHWFFEGVVMVIEKSGITDKESFLKFWLTVYDFERIEALFANEKSRAIVDHLRLVKGMDEYEAWHTCFRMALGRSGRSSQED